MFRKSALAMAMLGALATGTAVALGLGEIELKSALNQPLNAEVALLSASREELQELKVEVASPAAFARAGLERTLFLDKLRFNVKTNASGKPVIHITSRDVVREPFLDFLLELSWSKGRMLREYTVLVDPPVTMPAPAPALQAPAARAASRPAPPSSGRVTHTAQLPPVAVAPSEYAVQRNDTLWKIAQQVRPDAGVSMEQTMLGLQRANPQAFTDNNMNNLKAGYILRVPDREELIGVGQADAVRETRRQYAEWRDGQEMLGSAQASAQAASAAEPLPGARLELVAPDLSEPGVQAAGTGETPDLAALEKELMIANEALEAQRRQSEEMATRVTALEEQIQNMQRLIQLKDDELARLQAQVGQNVPATTAGEAAAASDGAAASGSAAQDAVADASMQGVVEAPPVDGATQGVSGELASATVVDGQAVPADLEHKPSAPEGELLNGSEGMVVEAGAADGGVPQESEIIPLDTNMEPAVLPTLSTLAAEPVEATAPESAAPEAATLRSVVDKLTANPMWLGAGALALLAAGLFGVRRKRGGDSDFQESILQAAREKSSAEPESEMIAPARGSAHSATAPSSLLSEFAASDMGSMRSDGEADPLAEADVYLAYGRHRQAEELIKDALESNPEHFELELKLLEVYLAARNQPAFDEQAQQLLGRLESSDDPMWETIAAMGREISPDNPLYRPETLAHAAREAGAEDATEVLALDGEAFDVAHAPGRGAAFEEQASATAGSDFDMVHRFALDSEEDEFKPTSVEFTPPESIFDELGIRDESLEPAMDSIEPDKIDLQQGNTLEFDLEGFDLGEEDAEPPGDGELADLDEVSTKLDLARAYLDMGDPEGARSILDEVIEEGSDDQKTEAQQILAKIA